LAVVLGFSFLVTPGETVGFFNEIKELAKCKVLRKRAEIAYKTG